MNDKRARNLAPPNWALNASELQKLQKLLEPMVSFSYAMPTRERSRQIEQLRMSIPRVSHELSQKGVALLSVFTDLLEQGWRIADLSKLEMIPPDAHARPGESIVDVKARLRIYMESSRNRQLGEQSVKTFLNDMLRIRNGPTGKKSIASVIDDGTELAKIIEKGRKLPIDERDNYLRKYFRPEIEVCDSDARCSDTGLKLYDIWRFFRHTWVSVYRPIPGRNMPILIRNKARKNRPIMGIAMLSSPVMKLASRDEWIGWTFSQVVENLYRGTYDQRQFIDSAYERLDQSIDEIRWDDIAEPNLISDPTAQGIDQLLRIASRASYDRDKELKLHFTENPEHGRFKREFDPEMILSADWLQMSQDHLFVSKRAVTLARILSAKMEFERLNLKSSPSNLRNLLTSKSGRVAVDTVLTEFQKAGLASQVMELSICGAVAPYGGLLTGKLVGLAMASREVNDALYSRYSDRVSIISSQMAGRPITRDATLKVITTTSLYGAGTSQYNRLHLRASDHIGISNDIRWEILKGKTAGFGQMHLSSQTHKLLRQLGWDDREKANRTNRFGEGTSTRMHQARAGLDALGLKSELVLAHETPRIVLGCDIFSNSRLNLMGQSQLIGQRKATLADISRAWRRRWLLRRIDIPGIIDRLKNDTRDSVYEELHINADRS